jgi:hypothetical protein
MLNNKILEFVYETIKSEDNLTQRNSSVIIGNLATTDESVIFMMKTNVLVHLLEKLVDLDTLEPNFGLNVCFSIANLAKCSKYLI